MRLYVSFVGNSGFSICRPVVKTRDGKYMTVLPLRHGAPDTFRGTDIPDAELPEALTQLRKQFEGFHYSIRNANTMREIS